VARSELVGRIPVGGDEEEVGVAELVTDGPTGGVDGRGGRALGLEGTAFGALGEDGGGAERLDSGALPAVGSFCFDLRHHGGGELLSWEVPPESLRIAELCSVMGGQAISSPSTGKNNVQGAETSFAGLLDGSRAKSAILGPITMFETKKQCLNRSNNVWCKINKRFRMKQCNFEKLTCLKGKNNV
jgi:hypothetical protein